MSFRYICEFYLFSDVTVLKSVQFVGRVEVGSNLRILVSVREKPDSHVNRGCFNTKNC